MDFAEVAVPKWIEAVKSEYGKPDTKYACVGYCFGAPYVMELLAEDWMTAGSYSSGLGTAALC